MTATRRRVPDPDDVTRPFWEACARRELVYQRCTGCAHRWLPASVVCPRCWSESPRWIRARGDATVFSYAVYHRAYHPAFKSLVPYVVAVIELGEGPRLVSNVVGIHPRDVGVGMPVRLDFQEVEGGLLPVFRPEEKAGGV